MPNYSTIYFFVNKIAGKVRLHTVLKSKCSASGKY